MAAMLSLSLRFFAVETTELAIYEEDGKEWRGKEERVMKGRVKGRRE